MGTLGWFSQRLSLLKEILWRPVVFVVTLIYALLQLPANIVAWTLPLEEQARYQYIILMKRVPW